MPDRCGAKKTNGQPCLAWAMPNGRCRLHGGKSTGPPTGNKNALKYGIYSNGLHADERELWGQIKIDTLGLETWCWLIGMPDGLNHYYDLTEYAKAGKPAEFEGE